MNRGQDSAKAQQLKKIIWTFVGALLLSGSVFLLYRVHPLAPWLLALSIAIQLPLIVNIGRVFFGKSYRQRAQQRKVRFERDHDAAKWLADEQEESKSKGFRYWSKAGQMENALNRAQALIVLGRKKEALWVLAPFSPTILPKDSWERYALLVRMAGDKDESPTK